MKDFLCKNILSRGLYTLGLFLITIICTNQGFLTFDNTLVTKLFSYVQNMRCNGILIPDNVRLIDTQYDNELVSVSNKLGRPLGTKTITDRKTLYTFLDNLSSTNSYNYIFLDLGFHADYNSPWDSLLFNKIRTMPRIVVAQSGAMDSKWGLEHKAGFVEYTSMLVNGDMSCYSIADRNGFPSFAARAYEELYETKLSTHIWGTFCSDNRKLAMRTITPKQRLIFNIYRDENKNPNNRKIGTSHLGRQSVCQPLGIETSKWNILVDKRSGRDPYKGKDIIIGNFSEQDLHSTYCGNVYGPIINYNAFLALKNGEHLVNIWCWILLIVLFYGMVLFAEIAATISVAGWLIYCKNLAVSIIIGIIFWLTCKVPCLSYPKIL